AAAPVTAALSSLPLHDALPILWWRPIATLSEGRRWTAAPLLRWAMAAPWARRCMATWQTAGPWWRSWERWMTRDCMWRILGSPRAEEHTSELQSRLERVCRLLH